LSISCCTDWKVRCRRKLHRSFSEANIVRDGGDVTVVAVGRMVHVASEAAEIWPKGVNAK
jgi:pyruvate/2-oxoglutarate/acetoin dehydrogenase E1 component